MNRRLLTAIGLIFMVLFFANIAGCKSLTGYGCPYGISRQEISEDRVKIEFINTCEDTVKSALFVINISTAEDNEPYRVEYTIVGDIRSGETDEFSLPLNYILSDDEDASGAYIESVYAARIEFTDGNVWTDPYGHRSV